jgi:1-pyrroline-5-carboxylate dehydrogenase
VSSDPLAGLPRVTYANGATDFSGLHALIDQRGPSVSAALCGHDTLHHIEGRLQAGGAFFSVASPIDRGLCLGRRLQADAATITAAVQAARRASPAWRQAGWGFRVQALRQVADRLQARRFEIAMAVVLEVGKSRLEALGEIEEAIDLIRFYCDQVQTHQGWELSLRSGPGGETGHDRLRPYGCFAVIAPFNYPVALALGMSSAALLGGNTVILKPTAQAVLSGRLIAELFDGLPPGSFNLLCGDAEVGQALARHEGIDGIAFTGSHEVGMQLLRHAAAGPYMKPVLAELGGKNSAFVTASASLDDAAWGVARSAFGMSGQKCSALSRVYVQASIRDRFLDRLAEVTAQLRVDDPRASTTFTGPVIDARAARRYVDTLKRVGPSHCLLGGTVLERPCSGAYLAPTVLVDLPPQDPAHTQELFLPVLSVQCFDDLGAAIEASNASALGLTAGIYTTDDAELALFDDCIEAGVLYANRASGATTGAWPGYQTFCGWKGSGLTGKGGLGTHYVQQFMREQSRTRAARSLLRTSP